VAFVAGRGGIEAVDPARGRFRSYLLGAVKHFLADQHDHAHRVKRGGRGVPQSLDAPAAEESGAAVGSELVDSSASVADSVFDRQWALAVMARALTALESEFKADGKSSQFEALKPWLVGESAQRSQANASARLGLSESALKVAVHGTRKRFRDTVRHEIAQTLDEPDSIDEELRYVVEGLAAG